VQSVLAMRSSGSFRPVRPECWDGRAGERAIEALLGP
jgi:hypothetical protein